jgi:hypothetical protein
MLLNIILVCESLKKIRKPLLSMVIGTALVSMGYAHAGEMEPASARESAVKSFEVLVPVEGDGPGQTETHEVKELEMFIRSPGEKPTVPADTPAVVDENLVMPEDKFSVFEESPLRDNAVTKRKFADSAQWTFSVATWISEGETNWNHTAGTVLLGDPTSELVYSGSRAYTAEFEALVDKDPWYGRFVFGYGAGDTGELIDDDYLSAAGATNFGTSVAGEHRYSRTLSDARITDMLYTQLDIGKHIYKKNNLKLSAFMGYQFWSEEYQAEGVNQLECTSIGVLCSAPGTISNLGQRVITNTANWHSMRMGLRTEFKAAKLVDFNLDAAIIPLTYLSNSDVHHLRTDLAKDPSIRHTGIGWGYNVEGTVRFNVYSNIFLKAGYRYWKLEVNNGDTIFFGAAGGASNKLELNKFTSYRHGGTVGLEYLF